MKEYEMYEPIRKLFVDLGFNVKAEINDIDIVCSRDDELILIEMKKVFSIKLLTQAIKRQRLSDNVYIAIIKPNVNRKNLRFENDKHILLKRLNLGLIYVFEEKKAAKIVFDPADFDLKRSKINAKNKRIKLKEEFLNRLNDENIGGVSGVKIVTRYRENALFIAEKLNKFGVLSIIDLIELGCDSKKTGSILQKNYYGWFIRVNRGKYMITDKGVSALKEYSDVVKLFN